MGRCGSRSPARALRDARPDRRQGRPLLLRAAQLGGRAHPEHHRARHRGRDALQLPLRKGLVAKVLPAAPRLAAQGLVAAPQLLGTLFGMKA